MKPKVVKQKIISPPEDLFERAKRVYISQIQKSDSRPQKIVEHLYLGSVGAAYSLKVLQTLNISHILTVCECLPPKFPNEFTYKIIPVTDEPSTKLSNYFNEAIEYIRNAILDGKNVLVHCFAGVSRSSTIVIAYLMKYHKMEYSQAFGLVKNKRSCICPNSGFVGQLKRFGNSLKEQRTKVLEIKI